VGPDTQPAIKEMTMATEVKPKPVPTVRGAPLVGSMLDFGRDTIKAIMDGWREQGDLVRFKVPFSLTMVVHPDYIEHILQKNHLNYVPVPWVSDAWRLVVGEGLLASSGSYWLRQRRLEQPGFHRQRIAGFAKIMTDTAADVIEQWRGPATRGEPVDLKTEMTRLTLDILAKAMFSADWEREAASVPEAVTIELEYMFGQLKSPVNIPQWLPTPGNRRFKRARAQLDAMVYRLIAERRRSGQDPGDLLSMLIHAKDAETGEVMTDQQIRDEIMTLIFAGHETVSCGLTWIFYLLSQHPDAARRLAAEVDEVLGGKVPTVEDLPRLRYMTMVIEEALRLYPPVWPIARVPLKDDTIGGYHIPKGTMLLVLPYVTHRHPKFWDNPEGFDPERFAPERSQGRHRFAYFPFSSGPRKCIGDYFAELEIQIVVAMIARHFELHLMPRSPVVPVPGITLRPLHPVKVRLAARSARSAAMPQPSSVGRASS
jgi:cytochrome P450